MKRLLKNIKESCNREEKLEEDSLLYLIDFFEYELILQIFLERFKNKILTT